VNVILFDKNPKKFYPLSLTRPISEFRIGIFTIKQKWSQYYDNVSCSSEKHLNNIYPNLIAKNNLWIDSTIIPNNNLIVELNSLKNGEALYKDDILIAFVSEKFKLEKLYRRKTSLKIIRINSLTDIFTVNASEICNDFKLIEKKDNSLLDRKSIEVFGDKTNIYIHPNAKLKNATLNSENGPIFIDEDCDIMENVSIRGPFSINKSSVVKMGAKIYEGCSIGPFCKIGGEVSNSVFFGYSSKSHDGFIGNSVIGKWCNLGADTNNSNLKNNYSNVKLWNYEFQSFVDTGLQFCGMIMGDHSKTGINTMINTGSVIGVGVNLFGPGFTRNFIPSFSWGGSNGFTEHKFNMFKETSIRVMKRRNKYFDENQSNLYETVFDMTKRYRNY
jgi:UDP-N-acetylglucosamine diphosphorylase/glucosamine-1-phosphate N-acetyltransferase